MHRFAVGLTTLAALLAGCGTISAAPARQMRSAAPSGMPHLRHVVLLMLENREYAASSGPAYLTALGWQGAALSDDHGMTHPSLPNYLALLAGQTFGVPADVAAPTLPGPTPVSRVEDARLMARERCTTPFAGIATL
jgi:phosphatidylinositol-3-phosphatase